MQFGIKMNDTIEAPSDATAGYNNIVVSNVVVATVRIQDDATMSDGTVFKNSFETLLTLY